MPYDLVVPLLGPETGVPKRTSPLNQVPVIHSVKGWDGHGYFRKTIVDKEISHPLVQTPVGVGLCGARYNPSLDYKGLTQAYSGDSELYLAKYGYFGPYENKDSDGAPRKEQPYHTYVEVFKTAKPQPILSVWKGASQSSQGYRIPSVIQDGYPSFRGSQYIQGLRYRQLSLGDLDKYGTLVKPLILKVEQDLVKKAIEKAKVADLGEALVDIAELRVLHKLILSGFVKTCTNVAKAIGGGVNSLADARRVLDAFSSGWLTWSLAVRPTIQVMEDLYANWHKLSTTETYWTLRASSKDNPLLFKHIGLYNGTLEGGEIGTMGPPYYPQCYVNAPTVVGGGIHKVVTIDGQEIEIFPHPSGTPVYKQDTSIKLNSNISVELYTDWKFLITQLGLSNPVGLAWEAVPLSFVFDRVINVGKALEVFDGTPYVITRMNTNHQYVWQTRSTNGSTGNAIVTTRFPRAQTFAPEIPDGANNIAVYSSHPWGDTDLLENLSARLGAGRGYPDDLYFGELLTGASMYALLVGALSDISRRYAHKIGAKNRRMLKRVLK